MSTKVSNPRNKINFGNLIFRILTLQTTWFWIFLHDFGTKSKFNFGILILQTSWFTTDLHDLGTKFRFNLRILILQKKLDEYLQKPLIHDIKIILEILFFGIWFFKLYGFDWFCMIFGLNPGLMLGPLFSKPPGL